MGYSPWGHKELDMTELHTHKMIIIISIIMLLVRELCAFKKIFFTLNLSTVSTSALSFPFKNLPLPLMAVTANRPGGQIAKLALLG